MEEGEGRKGRERGERKESGVVEKSITRREGVWNGEREE